MTSRWAQEWPEAPECVLKCCPQGVWHDGLAPVDSILADYRTRVGYVVNSSTNFYKCPVPGACKVNSTTGGRRLRPWVHRSSLRQMPSEVHEIHTGWRQMLPVPAQRTLGCALALDRARCHNLVRARVLVAQGQARMEPAVATPVSWREFAGGGHIHSFTMNCNSFHPCCIYHHPCPPPPTDH